MGAGFEKEAVAYRAFSQAKVDLGVLVTSHLEVDTWAPCKMCSGQEVCCKNLVETLVKHRFLIPKRNEKRCKSKHCNLFLL